MDFSTVSLIYTRTSVFLVELHNLYSSPNIQKKKKNGLGGACSTLGERRGAYRALGGYTFGKETTWNTKA
jgi:hypothetical protein